MTPIIASPGNRAGARPAHTSRLVGSYLGQDEQAVGSNPATRPTKHGAGRREKSGEKILPEGFLDGSQQWVERPDW